LSRCMEVGSINGPRMMGGQTLVVERAVSSLIVFSSSSITYRNYGLTARRRHTSGCTRLDRSFRIWTTVLSPVIIAI